MTSFPLTTRKGIEARTHGGMGASRLSCFHASTRSSAPVRKRHKAGSALVICLIVLAAITAIVASFSATQRVTFLGVTRRVEKLRAQRMAESGLARAMAELQLQSLTVPATLQDEWALLGGQYGSERLTVGDDSFRVEIVDANARVNLNTATQDQLYRLPLTTEQVDSLLDWREAGITPRQEGAKDEYYTQLPEPYITAMRNLLSFDELLLVKGFEVSTLYDPPTEEQPNPYYIPGTTDQQASLFDLATVESTAPTNGVNGVNKTNINNGGAQQLAAQLVQRGFAQGLATQIANSRPYTTLNDVFSRFPNLTPDNAAVILDNYVATNAGQNQLGKININTAPEYVLASLPGITSDIAQAIVSRQSTGYQALGELTSVPGVSNQVLAQCADSFTIASSMFIVRVIGTAGNTSVPLQAIVSLTQNGPRVIKRIQLPFYDMRSYWRWDADTTADVEVWQKP